MATELTLGAGQGRMSPALNLAKNLAEPCTLKKLPPSRTIELAFPARFRRQALRDGLRQRSAIMDDSMSPLGATAPMRPVEYRIIADFPDYRVGTDGSVWSRKTGVWVLLSGSITPNVHGYCEVGLSRDSKMFYRRVSRIVLEAFVGPCPAGMEACHDPDRTRTNNHLENLRWGTRLDNRSDCIKHGTQPRGTSHGRAKLTDADIPVIRELIASGMTYVEISKRFPVSAKLISKIDRGIVWRHVP